MIGALGLILAILSVIGLIDPKTPFGKKILNIPYLKNDKLIKFYPIYKYYLFLISRNILAVIIYLMVSVYDFYLMQSFVLACLYLGLISLFFLLIVFAVRLKSFKGEFINSIKNLFKKYLILFSGFILILSLLAILFNQDIESQKIENVYLKIKSKRTSEHLLKLTDISALEFRNRYAKEIKLISNLNLINQYKKKYVFDYNLSLNLDTTKKVYSDLINKTKKIYNSHQYTDKFNSKIKVLENFNKGIKTKPIHPFPVELQPYFVSSLIVSSNTKYFASLAVGSKVYLINLYNNTIEIFGIIGLIIIIIILSLLSLWLTFKLAKYNEKYSMKNENSNNYFFITVSIFGLLLALLGLI